MAYDITQLKNDLTAFIHGTTLNKVVNLDGLINRGARQVLLDVDPQETKRIVPIASTIYNQVFDYPLPVDLKGNKVIDIRPQVNRQPWEWFPQEYNQAFDLSKNWWSNAGFTINFNSSLKTIRINASFLPPGIVINTASVVQGEGTWTNGGGATVPTIDNINFVSYSSSIQLNLLAGQASGFLENSTFSPVNLSNELNQGTQFLFTYLPTPTAVTSVELRWGTDSANYYSVTTSITQQNTVFQTGWNLLAFPWLGATVVGVPNAASIGYVRVTWNYNSTLQTAVHLNGIASSLGTIMEIEYYSKFLFRDAITNAFQETVTADSNIVNLDTETCNLLLYQVGWLCAQQLQGIDALFFDNNFFQQQYTQTLQRYKAMYKSEIQKPRSIYYQQPNPGFTQYWGWGNYRW